jgi:hypothetical protein
MRKHPGGSALDIATLATVQPESSRSSAIISLATLAVCGSYGRSLIAIAVPWGQAPSQRRPCDEHSRGTKAIPIGLMPKDIRSVLGQPRADRFEVAGVEDLLFGQPRATGDVDSVLHQGQVR